MVSQQEPCLELRQVRYTVGSARTAEGLTDILSGVDITARVGQVTVIIGPNGAGKTTTLNCAQGLLRPSSGAVELLGQDPYRAGAELRARVGVMLQDGGLPQSVPPAVLLKHVARLHRDPWPLDDLVERLDMGRFLTTGIRRLSGGQRQRVALAAALIGRPEVVFLDEPSAGLDPQSRQTVYQLIDELRAQGRGIVLTTHLLEEAQRLADSVFILRDGVVVRHGTVAELTEDSRGADPGDDASGSHSARRLVFVAPRALTQGELDTAPLPLKLDGAAANHPGARWAALGVGDPEHLSRLAAWWEAIGLMPSEISFESRTLEDVFWEVSAP